MLRQGQAPTGRTLVVGCGFIGARFAAELVARNVETIVLTRSEPGEVKRTALGASEVVVADAASAVLDEALHGVGHVIYAAGGLMPAESEQDPALDAALTLRPLVAVLDAIAVRPGVRLTYISSGGTVYGRPRYLPVDEEHPKEPMSAYGINKLAAENLVEAHSERHGVSARILRCSNVYGETQPANRGQGVIATFLERSRRGEPLVLYGDGAVVRDYVHVDDVVDAGIALLGRPIEPTVVNVGLGEGYSLGHVVELIDQISGGRLTIERRPARDFDVPEIVLDVSRLKSLVPYEPIALDEGVRRLLSTTGPDELATTARPRAQA
jgi:UDP-glucose 4-epimerase